MFVPPPQSLAERYRMEDAVSLLLDYPAVKRAAMQTMMQALNYAPEVARDLVLFVPMAYMRLLLQPVGVRFPATCVLVDGDGNEQEIVLAEQVVFEAAMEYAAQHLAAGMPRHDLKGLIVRSAEFDPVNAQLLEGIAPPNVELAPVNVSLEPDAGDVAFWSGW